MAFLKISVAALAAASMACAGQGGAPMPAQTPEKAEAAKPAAPAPGSYEAGILQFQQEREAALKTDTGWLTIAGLFFLSQPRMTFGSDPLNDIVLPASAPPKAGTFEVRQGKVTVKAEPGVTFQLGDKTITDAVLKSDGEGPPDRIGFNDLQLWVHMSGGRQSIRLRDKNSPLRKEFTGTRWFPIDKAYRVEATFEPYPKPRTVQVPNMLGDIDNLTVPGVVSFTLNGQALKMEPVTEGDDKVFWFIFRDLTSGKETYPAARFLYMDGPVNGRMFVDFNRAENPPCAYNPYATCPLPPEQNRLRVRVEAGEKIYAAH
jgi:uncharacterized protein (DUF1684 family)